MQPKVPATTPVIVLAVADLHAACTTVGRDEARDTEQQLAAAGFDIKLGDKPARREHLDSLPQHRLLRFDRNGRAYYIYADAEWCECMYAGVQADYDAYRRLAIADEREEGAVMDEDAVMDWDLWGPWLYG